MELTRAGEKGSINTDERGKCGLLSRPLVLQSNYHAVHCMPAQGLRHAQSFCPQSPLEEVLGGMSVHHSFLSQPVRSDLFQQAQAWPVFTIHCSLRITEKIKERIISPSVEYFGNYTRLI